MAYVETAPIIDAVCDCCDKGTAVKSRGSLPYGWAEFNLRRDQYDYQGAAVADGSVKKLFCDDCHSDFMDHMNAWAETRKKAAPPLTA